MTDKYVIWATFDSEWSDTHDEMIEFDGTWTGLQEYIEELKEVGYYNISASCVSDY